MDSGKMNQLANKGRKKRRDLAKKIFHPDDLGKYYQNERLVEEYITKRFGTPLGEVQHKAQVHFINQTIRKYGLKKVLEVAPGPARLTTAIHVSEPGYALDFSPQMLLIAKKRIKMSCFPGEWNLLRGNAFNLPFKSNSFDLVFSFRFIRHLRKEKREQLYHEIKRVLNTGGFLIFDAPNFDVEFPLRRTVGFNKFPVYDELWKKETLRSEIESNKFKIINLKGNINYFYMQKAISQLLFFPKVNVIGKKIIKELERGSSKKPLEWLVLCQKE